MTIDADRLRALAERDIAQGFTFADCIQLADVSALLNERDALSAMLRRIRAWDMLDVAGDGAYWKREIDAALDGAKEPT